MYKRKYFALKKKFYEARRKKANLKKVSVGSFFGLLAILDMDNSSLATLNSWYQVRIINK